MSTITTDQQPILALSPDSAPATPTGGAAKRGMFGRKKKSAANLGSSPSINILASPGSSLKSGQSVESLQDKATSDSSGGKGIKSVFKRKGKSETSAGTSIGSIEEDGEAGKDDEGGEHKERASEENDVLSYDSETDV